MLKVKLHLCLISREASSEVYKTKYVKGQKVVPFEIRPSISQTGSISQIWLHASHLSLTHIFDLDSFVISLFEVEVQTQSSKDYTFVGCVL